MKRNCLAMYSCGGEERKRLPWWWKAFCDTGESTFCTTIHLVLPVVLLGMAQHSVTKSADVSERSVALVAQLLKPQHGAVATVSERGLEKFENLQWKSRIFVFTFYLIWMYRLICLRHTCFKIFCSLMSFCLSLLGLFTIISKTSCPLFGMSTTKKTRSSRSLVTNLQSTNGGVELKYKGKRLNYLSINMVQEA